MRRELLTVWLHKGSYSKYVLNNVLQVTRSLFHNLSIKFFKHKCTYCFYLITSLSDDNKVDHGYCIPETYEIVFPSKTHLALTFRENTFQPGGLTNEFYEHLFDNVFIFESLAIV